jgi:hypothetical protein
VGVSRHHTAPAGALEVVAQQHVDEYGAPAAGAPLRRIFIVMRPKCGQT